MFELNEIPEHKADPPILILQYNQKSVRSEWKNYNVSGNESKIYEKIRKFCQISLTTPNENRALSTVYSKEITWNRINLLFRTFISIDKNLIKTKSYLIERELHVGH